jgi:hypothetical protein
MRLLPGQLLVDDRSYIDSFALAVARAKNHNLVADVDDNVSWGSYISNAKLDKYRVIFSARDLLNKNPEVIAELNSEAVIVGENWTTFAYHRPK